MPLKPLHTLESMTSDAYAEAWLLGPHFTSIYTRTYRVPARIPSRAILVFVHGLTEHVGRYTEVHAEFARRGINVFTYDLRGFGKTALDEEHRTAGSSYGKTDVEKQMDDMEWALAHASMEFLGLPLFLSGHSTGGGESLNFPIRRSAAAASLCGVIACSPLVLSTTESPYFGYWTPEREATGEDPYTHTDTSKRVQHPGLTHDSVFNEMSILDTLRRPHGTVRHVSQMLEWGHALMNENYAKWPPALPVLIFHGTDDQLTSHDASRDLVEKLPAKDRRFISYQDGRHELLHEPAYGQSMVDEIVGFVEGHLA